MSFESALDVRGREEETKIEVRAETFMDAEDHEYGAIADALTKVQEYLDGIKDIVDRDNVINEDEPRLLYLAIERELENSIPGNFKILYKEAKEAGKPQEAANLITKNILGKLQEFVIEKSRFEFQKTPKLEEIIGTIDNALWGDEIDKPEDIEGVMKKLDKDISKSDIAVIQAKWNNPYLMDDQILAIRYKAEDENLLKKGKHALENPFARIARALEEAGANK